MLDNNKLFETILCINDEEHGEIISIKLQFISKPVLTANGNIDYKNITHNYTSPFDFLTSYVRNVIHLIILIGLHFIKLEIRKTLY